MKYLIAGLMLLVSVQSTAQTTAEIEAMKATFNSVVAGYNTLRAENDALIASVAPLEAEIAALEIEKTEVYNENVRITALLVAGIEQIDDLRAQLAAGVPEGDVAHVIKLEHKVTALEGEVEFKQEMLERVFENARFLADRRGYELPLQADVWADLLSYHIIPTEPEYPLRERMCSKFDRRYAGSTLPPV